MPYGQYRSIYHKLDLKKRGNSGGGGPVMINRPKLLGKAKKTSPFLWRIGFYR